MILLKEKKQEICIRVSIDEKKKLQKKARKSGLSLSSYLRKMGLEKEIYSISEKDFYVMYMLLNEFKNSISNIQTKEKIVEGIDQIMKNYMYIYNSNKKGDDENGNNKNMGG